MKQGALIFDERSDRYDIRFGSGGLLRRPALWGNL